MNWLDFGWDPPNVKGQWTWSKYAIFTSLTQNLKNPWVDFHQIWYMDAPPGVQYRPKERLQLFSWEFSCNQLAHRESIACNWLRDSPKVKGQWIWSKYAIFTSLTQNLKNPWVDFHQTWYRGAPPGVHYRPKETPQLIGLFSWNLVATNCMQCFLYGPISCN